MNWQSRKLSWTVRHMKWQGFLNVRLVEVGFSNVFLFYRVIWTVLLFKKRACFETLYCFGVQVFLLKFLCVKTTRTLFYGKNELWQVQPLINSQTLEHSSYSWTLVLGVGVRKRYVTASLTHFRLNIYFASFPFVQRTGFLLFIMEHVCKNSIQFATLSTAVFCQSTCGLKDRQ